MDSQVPEVSIFNQDCLHLIKQILFKHLCQHFAFTLCDSFRQMDGILNTDKQCDNHLPLLVAKDTN